MTEELSMHLPLAALSVSLVASAAVAQPSFAYAFGDPVPFSSQLTLQVGGPGCAPPCQVQTDTDVGQATINGASSFTTSVVESAFESRTNAACGAGLVAWDVDSDSQAELIAYPRFRSIQFLAFSEGDHLSTRTNNQQCGISVFSTAHATNDLAIPFTLTGPATVAASAMRVDRRGDTTNSSNSPAVFSALSKLSWKLYVDVNGNGLIDAGEPVADGGQAQQSASAALGQLKDISGSYSGSLPAGRYVVSCSYEATDSVAGSFSVPNTSATFELSPSVVAEFRLEVL